MTFINERRPAGAHRARRSQLGDGPAMTRGFQIGPKIRIGGSIGKIGQNVKNTVTKAATDTGHAIGNAASNPWVDAAVAAALAATGVGAPAAAGIMAATRGGGALLKPGGNIGSAVKGGVQGAAMGAGAAKLGSLASILHGGAGVAGAGAAAGMGGGGGGAADSIDSAIPNSALGIGDADSGGGFMDWMKGLISGGGSDRKGNFGKAGDLLGDLGNVFGGGSGGSSSLIDKLLLGGTIASGAADKARQQGFQDKAAAYATGDYDKNAPLRDQARSLIQDRSTPDMSAMFSNPGNVYDQQRRGTPMTSRAPLAAAY